MNHDQIVKEASQLLREAYRKLAASYSLHEKPHLTLNAPKNLKEMTTAYHQANSGNGHYPILSSHLDCFLGKAANVDFRFIHDMMHIELQVDVDYAGEMIVHAVLWSRLACYADSYEVADMIRKIYVLDTYGQTVYYNQHDKFVANQIEFVSSRLGYNMSTIARIAAGGWWFVPA